MTDQKTDPMVAVFVEKMQGPARAYDAVVIQAVKDAVRKQGHSQLHGRPLDEDGNIELRVEDPHPR